VTFGLDQTFLILRVGRLHMIVKVSQHSLIQCELKSHVT
jgi:hypothetical protein